MFFKESLSEKCPAHWKKNNWTKTHNKKTTPQNQNNNDMKFLKMSIIEDDFYQYSVNRTSQKLWYPVTTDVQVYFNKCASIIPIHTVVLT